MTQLVSNELIFDLFNLVVPAGVTLGLAFGIAQFLFSQFMQLAFPKKNTDL